MNIDISIIFAFAAMLFWGIGDFLIQRTTRKLGALATLTWIGIIGSVILLPFVWSDFHLLNNRANVVLLLMLGLITFVSGWLCFAAFKEGKISVIDVILILELPVAIALSFIFLNERLSFFQALTISFIIIGVVLLTAESLKKMKINLEKGVLLAVAAALLMGGMNFLTGISARAISPLMAIWGQSVFIAVVGVIWLYFRSKTFDFLPNARSIKTLLLLTGIIDTLAWLWYAYATKHGEIGITTAITESYPAIAITLGVWINKEKIMPHQWFGAGIAIVCSIILSVTV
jgi:drug/metabolite transporter (DMT)-like permease